MGLFCLDYPSLIWLIDGFIELFEMMMIMVLSSWIMFRACLFFWTLGHRLLFRSIRSMVVDSYVFIPIWITGFWVYLLCWILNPFFFCPPYLSDFCFLYDCFVQVVWWFVFACQMFFFSSVVPLLGLIRWILLFW